MSKLKITAARAAAIALFASVAPATVVWASTGGDTSAALAKHSDALIARRGADDPAGDDRGRGGRRNDDGPKHAQFQPRDNHGQARHGADDGPGDIRHGRGADDLSDGDDRDHDRNDDNGHDRHGGDDGAGHDAGDDHGGDSGHGGHGGGDDGGDHD